MRNLCREGPGIPPDLRAAEYRELVCWSQPKMATNQRIVGQLGRKFCDCPVPFLQLVRRPSALRKNTLRSRPLNAA